MNIFFMDPANEELINALETSTCEENRFKMNERKKTLKKRCIYR